MLFVARSYVLPVILNVTSVSISTRTVKLHGKAATRRLLCSQALRRPFSSNVLYELRENSSSSERSLPSKNDTSLTQQVRHAMRKVAHPVVAITVSNLPQTSEPTASTDAGEGTSPSLQAGMLASSFNTVSLDPDPIVSFNVRLPSRTYDAIVQTGKFEVSPIWNIHAAKAFESRQNNRNKMLPYLDRLTNGRLFGLKCEWLEQKSIEVADHVIIIGKVIEVVGMPENKSPLGALVYSDGQYRFATDSVVETLDRMKEEQIEQRARRKEEEKESRGRRREQRREEQLKREEEKDERLARLRDEKREREREEKQKAKEERLQMRERKREEKERLDLLITSL